MTDLGPRPPRNALGHVLGGGGLPPTTAQVRNRLSPSFHSPLVWLALYRLSKGGAPSDRVKMI